MKSGDIVKKYKDSIMSGIAITIIFIIPGFYIKESTILAIGGLLFSIPVRLFYRSYTKPILEIKDIGHRQVSFRYKENVWNYRIVTVDIENNGRSSAKICKGYEIFEDQKERICWTDNSEIPNATINSRDHEKLDIIATRISGSERCEVNISDIFDIEKYISRHENTLEIPTKTTIQIPEAIFPTEKGWEKYPWNNHEYYMDRHRQMQKTLPPRIRVLVTASNTEPKEKEIEIEDLIRD